MEEVVEVAFMASPEKKAFSISCKTHGNTSQTIERTFPNSYSQLNSSRIPTETDKFIFVFNAPMKESF
jgi:hypothetical protein